jgi:hypothetical protein
MLKFLLLSYLFPVALFAQAQNDLLETSNRGRLPMRVGDVQLVRGHITQQSGVVLDDQGTAYLLTVLANGENNLLRISRKGAVKELVMYRGWPYVLDKRGRLYAFDVSWKTSFRNKVPYMSMRALKSVPVAFGLGVALYGLALLDESFIGFIPFENFHPSTAFWDGIILYYGIDGAKTLFFTSHRKINRGGDFFRQLIAKSVTDLTPHQQYDDYVVSSRTARDSQTRFLSMLAPAYAGSGTCLEYLTRMNLR